MINAFITFCNEANTFHQKIKKAANTDFISVHCLPAILTIFTLISLNSWISSSSPLPSWAVRYRSPAVLAHTLHFPAVWYSHRCSRSDPCPCASFCRPTDNHDKGRGFGSSAPEFCHAGNCGFRNTLPSGSGCRFLPDPFPDRTANHCPEDGSPAYTGRK